MLTYEVDNYSNISFANTYIKIDYSGTIFKDHWWKNVDYNGSRSIKFDYDYGLGKFQKK
ncbi:hypothetical protein [Haploplasma axanthum]|uniref:Uncharacterized protein n=1 Tax=Haploplasma axanthum TaxID=29552 RepID=A0A449BDF7_HAPAX|nr:hypothetical protein [Haploplasma axanthum]VEU80457.1 Uncharacterised protein [Haploplasma axanthum]